MRALLKGNINGYRKDQANVVLMISIDPYYKPEQKTNLKTKSDGEHFNLILKELNAPANRFKKIDIIITDELQVYDLMADGLTEAEARKRCKELGEAWFQRNIGQNPLLRELEYIKIGKIYRWRDFVQTNEYQQKIKPMFDMLYKDDDACRKAIDNSAGGFVKRRISTAITNHQTIDDVGKERLKELSRQYALEEAAVVALWSNHFKEHAWQFLIYTQKGLNQAIYWALQKFITNIHGHMMLHLYFEFTAEVSPTDGDNKQPAVGEKRQPSPTKQHSPTGSPGASPPSSSPLSSSAMAAAMVPPSSPFVKAPVVPLPTSSRTRTSLMNVHGFLKPPAAAVVLPNSLPSSTVAAAMPVSFEAPVTPNGLVSVHVNGIAKVTYEVLSFASQGDGMRYYELLNKAYAQLQKNPNAVNSDSAVQVVVKTLNLQINNVLTLADLPMGMDYTQLLNLVYQRLSSTRPMPTAATSNNDFPNLTNS